MSVCTAISRYSISQCFCNLIFRWPDHLPEDAIILFVCPAVRTPYTCLDKYLHGTSEREDDERRTGNGREEIALIDRISIHRAID